MEEWLGLQVLESGKTGLRPGPTTAEQLTF